MFYRDIFSSKKVFDTVGRNFLKQFNRTMESEDKHFFG